MTTNANIKSYTSPSNARRALKQIGTAALQAYEKLVTVANGEFKFDLNKAEKVQAAADAKQNDLAETKSVADKKAAVKVHQRDYDKKVEAEPKKAKVKPVAKAKAKPIAKQPKASTPVEIVRESTVENPCLVVWNTADEMKGARRKDVIEACMKKGVAFYTARTQYQLWRASKIADEKK